MQPDVTSFSPFGLGVTLIAAAVYWSLLALPGYALVRRLWPQALLGGAPSAVAFGYLGTFALLTPVNIVGYACELPLAVLSTCTGGLVVLAIASLHDLRPRFATPPMMTALVFAVLTADLALALHNGSFEGGDGRYHTARVRMLLTHGFNGWDPFVAGGRLDAVYHGNLYHALIAVSAQLLRVDAPAAWAFALFFAKCAASCAVYQIVWSVLRQRWLALSAMALFVVYMAPVTTRSYPNMTALTWLLLLGFALLVEFARDDGARWPLVGLAATAVVLPQVHGLYYVFLSALAVPVLLLLAVRRTLRRPATRGAFGAPVAVALVALSLGAPLFAVSQWNRLSSLVERPSRAEAETQAPATLPAFVGTRYTRIEREPERERSIAAREQLHARSPQAQLVVALILALWLGLETVALLPIAALVATCGALLYVPPLYSLCARIAGAPWVVGRLEAVLSTLHIALVPAIVFALGARAVRSDHWPRVCLLVALAYGWFAGIDSGTSSRAQYLDGAGATALRARLVRHAQERAFLARAIPAGAVVAAPLEASGALVVDCDCYPLALGLEASSHGVADMEQRRIDIGLLLGGHADRATRLALLRRYGVRYLAFPAGYDVAAVERAYGASIRHAYGGRVFEIDTGTTPAG